MKQQATFEGWDFTAVWGIVEGTSYPYLRFSPPPFKLAVNISGRGSVSVDPPSADGTYAPGTVVMLTAVPSGPTDVFIRWVEVVPRESPTVTVVMDIHRSATAAFGPRIEINCLADLAKIGNDPGYLLADVLYVLTADIDASVTAGWNDAGTETDVIEGFKPIGTSSVPFTGIFDGGRHTISGLIANRPATDYVGLFGHVGIGGHVRNLGLIGGAVAGGNRVGGLVGYNYYGTVSNGYATSAVGGSTYVGGLVGRSYSGAVSNCCATGAVGGSTYVGGLVGGNYSGAVSNCYATGAVNGTAGDVGGLVGRNSGTVSNCYATGAVNGMAGDVGGLVGYTYYSNAVSNSYWDMQTSGQGTSAGGTGKTTAEMRQQATFEGWDFTDVWGIVENVTYPFLRLPADFDWDRDVDMADFVRFQGCFNGPNRPPRAGCAVAADLDGDADVDLADFLAFQKCFNGLNRPAKCR